MYRNKTKLLDKSPFSKNTGTTRRCAAKMIIYSKEMEFGKRVYSYIQRVLSGALLITGHLHMYLRDHLRLYICGFVSLKSHGEHLLEEMLQTTIPINTSSRLPKTAGRCLIQMLEEHCCQVAYF
jgi:hypothetical protein